MKTMKTSAGTTVSYSVAGSGPPPVLVHGAFSDHETNWAFVAPGLVLYEPAWPSIVNPDAMAALETLAAARAWAPATSRS